MTTGRRVVDRIDTLADWPATPDARYLLATGATTGATSQAQALTSGVITGKVYPPSNSTNAFGLYRANGTTQDFYYDSTNAAFSVGTSPAANVKWLVTFFGSGSSIFGQQLQCFANGAATDAYGTYTRFRANTGISVTNALTNYSNVAAQTGATITHAYGYYAEIAANGGGSMTNAYGLRVITNGSTGVGTLYGVKIENMAVGSTNNYSVYTGTGVHHFGDIVELIATNATTNAVQNAIAMRSTNAGAPAAGFGVGLLAGLKSSTTADQNAGRLTWEWDVATHASRASRGKLSAYYTSTERVCVDWMANSTVPLIGFLGATPVAKPAAYTQTYATAARTIAAYTTDAESAAYTGIDNLQAGTVYAQLTDLNALRTAYENLRASYDGLLQVVNSIIDDNQAYGLFA